MPENGATEFGLGNRPSDKQLAYDSGVMLAESPSWLATADAIGFGRHCPIIQFSWLCSSPSITVVFAADRYGQPSSLFSGTTNASAKVECAWWDSTLQSA